MDTDIKAEFAKVEQALKAIAGTLANEIKTRLDGLDKRLKAIEDRMPKQMDEP